MSYNGDQYKKEKEAMPYLLKYFDSIGKKYKEFSSTSEENFKGTDFLLEVDGEMKKVDAKFHFYQNPFILVWETQTAYGGLPWTAHTETDYILWCQIWTGNCYLISMDDIKNVDLSKFDERHTQGFTNPMLFKLPYLSLFPKKEEFIVDFGNLESREDVLLGNYLDLYEVLARVSDGKVFSRGLGVPKDIEYVDPSKILPMRKNTSFGRVLIEKF